jgi:hypothetical protein
VAAAGSLSWQTAATVRGIYDVAGPLPDGRLLVATDHGLQRVDPADGAVDPLITGYRPEGGIEDYLALGSGLSVAGAGCSFPATTAYVLQTRPPKVIAVDLGTGGETDLASISGVDTLNGIAFDRSGRFGDRLLVSGPHSGSAVVVALDCRGRATVVTSSAPRLEGGLAVAPPTFGPYGGALIAVDEFSGTVIAIRAEGTSDVVATGLPAGSDIGPESAGFVPPGFATGGTAYAADYDVGSGAHPGSGVLLRLDAAELVAAGVADGDLLVADEGGGGTYAVHCGSNGACGRPRLVGTASALAHVEGHLVLVADHPAATPRPLPAGRIGAASRGGGYVFVPYAVGVVILAALYLVYRRQTRRRL